MKKLFSTLAATFIFTCSVLAQGSTGSLTPAQVKSIWEHRVMPSVTNIDSTWNAVVFKSNDRYYVTASDFTKTTTTTASVVTGLSTDTLVSAGTYVFEATLFTTASGTGGYKVGISGSGTATNIIYNTTMFNVTTDSIVKTATVTSLNATTSSTAGIAYATAVITIKGTIVVNAAGILYVNFGQGTSNGDSVIKKGSTFYIRKQE